jgi:hypothetical protein
MRVDDVVGEVLGVRIRGLKSLWVIDEIADAQ